MSNINATNLGNPPECDPQIEQACDEVNKAFDAIPADIVDAMEDAFGPLWASALEDAWVKRRADELRLERDERRVSSEEP